MPPPDAPEAPLLFLEAQAQPDEAFYGRFFAEMFLYLHRRAPRQPWRALVLYPRRATERLDARYAEVLALPLVRRVYLEDLAAVPDPGFGLQLLSLLVEDPPTAAAHAQRLAQQARAQALSLPRSPLDCLDLLETILVYRLPQLTRQEIQAMLGFTHAELKQSRFYQEVTAESRMEGLQKGRQEGHLEGLQKGHLEGLQKGRLEESVTLVLRLLKRRLGSSLSLLHQQQVRQLSLEQTEALAKAVLDFQTEADLTAWLAALPGDKTSSN